MTLSYRFSRLFGAVALTVAGVALAGCAGSGNARMSGETTYRYYDENSSAFDSDVYYDPYYGYRGTGEFRPRYKLKPY